MGILAYLIAGIALVGALAGLAAYERKAGGDSVRVEWQAANQKAASEEAARQAKAKAIADASTAILAAAQQKATTFESKWRAERAKHPDSTLAGCSGSLQGASTGGQATPAAPLSLRFSSGFLRLWDRSWTGQTGEPVFGDQPTPAGGKPDTPDTLTAIGPGEVLDNHQANAEACSRDRRKLNSLIDQIKKLRAGWR